MFNKRFTVLAISIVCIVAAIIFIQNGNDTNTVIANNSASKLEGSQPNFIENNTSTIATSWQWSQINENAKKSTAPEKNKSLPFTAKFVYEALKAVKLDKEGNVIHDHDALLSLDEAILRIQNKLDSESLSILKSIIKDGLPGKAGEQTAKTVGDYYHYLEAKDEFSRANESIIDINNHETVSAVENDQLLYAELQSLRDIHLGNDVSSGLFRVTDSDAQYMFESMKLDADTELSEEAKDQKRIEIEAQRIQNSINITGWPDRYRAFQDAKQAITSASLSNEEMKTQITDLLSRYFTPDELKQIEHLNLVQL